MFLRNHKSNQRVSSMNGAFLPKVVLSRQEGIVPERWLWERSSMLIDLSWHKWRGIESSSWFPFKRRTLNCESKLIQGGIGPDNLLSLKFNVTRVVTSERTGGIGPVSSLLSKCKNFMLVIFAQRGMVRPISLWESLKSVVHWVCKSPLVQHHQNDC